MIAIYFCDNEVKQILERNLKQYKPRYTVNKIRDVWYIIDAEGYPYLGDPLGPVVDQDTLLLALNKIQFFFKGGWER